MKKRELVYAVIDVLTRNSATSTHTMCRIKPMPQQMTVKDESCFMDLETLKCFRL